MKVKMLVDNRVLFSKGSIVDAEDREAVRLLNLGFAVKVEENAEEPKKAVKKVVKKKEG